jgi:selenide,water dikinase
LAKLGGLDLKELLSSLQNGLRREPSFEDSGSFQSDGTILASTDIGPVVGVDLFSAGRIAALHGMSDIFASGGVPKWLLVTLITDPTYTLTRSSAVLSGIYHECESEGVQIIGGHTCIGAETMVGTTVLGNADAGGPIYKRGACPGDELWLSKELGTGLLLRSYKMGLSGDVEFQQAVDVMLTSNRQAAATMLQVGVRAATDVTGFGLLGHLSEMLIGGVGAQIDVDSVPVLSCVKSLASRLDQTIWIKNNAAYTKHALKVVGTLSDEMHAVLFDPQTNGGLLIAADPSCSDSLGCSSFKRIGRVLDVPELHLSS